MPRFFLDIAKPIYYVLRNKGMPRLGINPVGIGNAISFGSILHLAKTLRQTSHAIFSTSWTHTFPLATNCTKFSTETQLRLATVA